MDCAYFHFLMLSALHTLRFNSGLYYRPLHLRSCIRAHDAFMRKSASTATDAPPAPSETFKPKARRRWPRLLLALSGGSLALALGYLYVRDTRAAVHALWPLLSRPFDAEDCHNLAIRLGELDLLPRENEPSPSGLATKVESL